jgi:ABC-type hemin transport system ATPase subunit
MLHEGHLVRLGPPDDVITSESLRRVYGVDVGVMVLDRADGSRTRVCVPACPRHPA